MGSFLTQFKVLPGKTSLITVATDILLIPVFQNAPADKPAGKGKKKATEDASTLAWTPWHADLDSAMQGELLETLKAEKFNGELNKRRIIRVGKSDNLKARWVVVLGLGAADKLTLRKLTQAYQATFKATFGFAEVKQAVVVLPAETGKLSVEQFIQSSVFGAIQATYKTAEADADKIHNLEGVGFLSQSGQKLVQSVLDDACIMGLAEAFTKDLANKPANHKRAETLAEAARSLSKIPGITVSVLSDLAKIRKEMPAFWAVAQGAAKVDPPRFIEVHYQAPGAKKPRKKLALVGKGVIFDTGGVQVKPGNSMNDMKFDMTGAASVLAAIKAAAELKLQGIHVSAYVAATANFTGEEAYLPDSIIDSASGKKIEIRHTDAEGRVTLADAVHVAAEAKPDEIVTVATLTGSAAMAVGHAIALMGNNDGLLNRMETACKAVGEPVQKLEIWEEDYEDIKSDRDAADLSNTGKGKGRGHLTAGAFVISFGQDIPMAHLDIAGGDAKDGNATGISVKGLIEYLRNEAS